MITLNDAIHVLNTNIVVIRGKEAFDIDGNSVEYDMAQAEAKLAEMQMAEVTAWQDKDMAKQSAMAKLAKLGLTEDEIKAMLG
jgi:hypothetical protein